MSLHQKQVHPTPVEDCFGCRVSSVRLNTKRLRLDNREHRTQAELGRETLSAARAAGVDVQAKKRWI